MLPLRNVNFLAVLLLLALCVNKWLIQEAALSRIVAWWNNNESDENAHVAKGSLHNIYGYSTCELGLLAHPILNSASHV